MPILFSLFLLALKKYEERPPADSCSKCHQEIYKQWESSRHSTAAQGRRFSFLSHNANIGICLSCHRPATIWTAIPESSLIQGQTGIDCATCHWFNGFIVGAGNSKAANRAHALFPDKSIANNSYACGRCHQKPFREFQPVPGQQNNLSCQTCHLKRIAEEKIKLKNNHKRTKHQLLADHSFRIEDLNLIPSTYFFKLNSCNITTTTLEINFTLASYVPHSVPAVEFGENRMIVSAQLLNEKQQQVLSQETVFTAQNPLGPLSQKEFNYSFQLPEEKLKNLILTVFHQRHKNDARIIMCREEFKLPIE
ncbi:MAG: cytochrome c family protein [Candidatus Sumerlaeia bacterium]|nr:cytochrome c family protein [Candidatus Sumerlaeia bacterium]